MLNISLDWCIIYSLYAQLSISFVKSKLNMHCLYSKYVQFCNQLFDCTKTRDY